MYTSCINTHTNHTYIHTPKNNNREKKPDKNDRQNIHGKGKIRDGERKGEKGRRKTYINGYFFTCNISDDI